MATISNTPRPGYVWDSADNVWYPIGVGAHQHTNAADTPAVMPYSTYAAAGKNKIINGDFYINQRAFSSTTTNATFGFDRWSLVSVDGTNTYSSQTFTLGTAPVVGYEGTTFARLVSTGQTLTSALTSLQQKIESVRTYAGQTITVSFWAKASSGTPNVSCWVQQSFGSGGSTAVQIGTTKQAITTSWARYSFVFNVPSISGKTIGTNDSFQILLTTSAGSDRNSYTDSLGIQSATVDFWGVQAEAGSVATAFQTATGNPASELAACQRYYTTSIPTGYSITDFPIMGTTGAGGTIFTCSQGSTNDLFGNIQYAVTMRTTPTFTIYSGNNRTAGSIRDMVTGTDIAPSATAPQTGQNKNYTYMGVGSFTSNRQYGFHYTASAEL